MPPCIRIRKPDPVPLSHEVHRAIVGVGTSEDLPAAFQEALAVLSSASGKDQEVAVGSFAACITGMPPRCAAYADLLQAVHGSDPALAASILQKCVVQFGEACSQADWHGMKTFLRLFGCLSARRQLQEAAEEDLAAAVSVLVGAVVDPPQPQHFTMRDAVTYTCLAALPWFPPATAASVESRLGQYATVHRQRSQSLACRRPILVQQYNFIQDEKTRVFENDWIDCLYLELRGGGWEDAHRLVVPPSLSLDQGGEEAVVHRFAITGLEEAVKTVPQWAPAPTVICPDVPTALQMFTPYGEDKKPVVGVQDEAQDSDFDAAHELPFNQREAMPLGHRAVLRELTVDIVHCFHPDVELLHEVLRTLPKCTASVYPVVDAVFGSAFTLPHAPLPTAFYISLLSHLCKGTDSPYALPVVEAFDTLLSQVPVLDPELSMRLTRLFSGHLSNHRFKWNWETEKDQDHRTGTCKKLFVFELLQHLTRTAGKTLLSAVVPPHVDKARCLEEEREIRYKFKDAGVHFKRDADTLLLNMRDNCSPEEALEHLQKMKDASDKDRAEVLVNCLLFLGSDTIAHERHLFHQYAGTIKQAVPDPAHLITAASHFWQNHPHHCVMTMAHLLQLDIVAPIDVVQWLFTEEMTEMYERSFIWEIVYMTIDHLAEKVWKAFEQLVDLEGALEEAGALDYPSKATKAKVMGTISKRIARLRNLVHNTYLFELRQGLMALFEGLVKCVDRHYRKEPRELAKSNSDEVTHRRVAAKNFVWCRCALGHFNAIGRRYLPFILPFLDELQDMFLANNVPSVVLNTFANWRSVRGRRVAPTKGDCLLFTDSDRMVREVYRRVCTTRVGGEEVTSNLYTRSDEGLVDLTAVLARNQERDAAPVSSESGSSDDEAGASDHESLNMEEDAAA